MLLRSFVRVKGLICRKSILAQSLLPTRHKSMKTHCQVNEKDREKRIVWVDLEMTGLNLNQDYIIEMSCIVTDAELQVIAEGPTFAIKQPDHILDGMGDWCLKHHTEVGKCVLAGNSVHEDRRFLSKHMPRFLEHLHYRIIDVSTIKELCRRWYPDEFQNVPKKELKHRALDDIRESIEELRYYRTAVFK